MVTEAAAPSRAITLDDVAGVVMRYYGISMEDLRGPSREARYVRPRQAFMYLGRWVAQETCYSIAAHVNREHSNVSTTTMKVGRQRKQDEALDYDLRTMASELYEIAGYRPPEGVTEPSKVKFFNGCEVTVSRYIFGLTDLMVTLASNGVPRGAWIERAEIEGGNIKLVCRWTRDLDEVAS